jgi:hypothetical protein
MKLARPQPSSAADSWRTVRRIFRWARRLSRWFNRNESGATMTEFVIMLPIFVLIFNGVMILGEYTRKGSEPPVHAYKATFGKVIDFQKSAFAVGWSMQSTAGGGYAGDQLAGTGWVSDASPVHNRSTAVNVAANAAEASTYGLLVTDGHMGESFARTSAPGLAMDINGCEGIEPPASNDCYQLNGNGPDERLTRDITDLVGGSEYAEALLDDSIEFSGFSGNSFLDVLNDSLDILGARPALAAGIRYGTVSGRHEQSFEFGGLSKEMNAYYSSLIPPSTTGGSQGPRVDALRATAVTRLTMESHDHYSELPGINWSYDLPKVSHSVPDYP